MQYQPVSEHTSGIISEYDASRKQLSIFFPDTFIQVVNLRNAQGKPTQKMLVMFLHFAGSSTLLIEEDIRRLKYISSPSAIFILHELLIIAERFEYKSWG